MEAENARPLTKQEVQDAGFVFSDPAWEIANQLKEIRDDIGPLRWQVHMLAEEIPRARRDVLEGLRILGQTIERATAPWYVRIFWTWKAKKQAKQMAAWKAMEEKNDTERREKLQQQLMKARGGRFKSRF